MNATAHWAAWIVGVSAALVVLWKFARSAYGLAQKLDALHDLAQLELTPNHGGSIKDRVARIPALEKDLRDHIDDATRRTVSTQRRFANVSRIQRQHAAVIAEQARIIARLTSIVEAHTVPTEPKEET